MGEELLGEGHGPASTLHREGGPGLFGLVPYTSSSVSMRWAPVELHGVPHHAATDHPHPSPLAGPDLDEDPPVERQGQVGIG